MNIYKPIIKLHKAEAQRILPFGNNRFDMPHRLIGIENGQRINHIMQRKFANHILLLINAICLSLR